MLTAQESIAWIYLYESREQNKRIQIACPHVRVFYHEHLLSFEYPWETSGVTDSNIKKCMVIETTKCVWKRSRFDLAAKGHAIQFTLNAEYSSQQNTWKQMILSEPTATLFTPLDKSYLLITK